MEEKSGLMCSRCNKPLEMHKAFFSYLDHSFNTEVLRCPECGQVFVPESLARGKMAQVEVTVEDK